MVDRLLHVTCASFCWGSFRSTARSLINKFDTFEAIVNELDVDIIGVTESWATPSYWIVVDWGPDHP